MKRTRTIDCLVQFNEVELRGLTTEVTRLFWKRAHLEEEKKETAKAFADQIADLSMEISEHMEELRLGGRMQPVVCVEEFNTPEPGKKTITRTDTGEVIAEKEMTLDEINDMFVQNGDDEIPEGTEGTEGTEAPDPRGDGTGASPEDAADMASYDCYFAGLWYRRDKKVYLCSSGTFCHNCAFEKQMARIPCDFCSKNQIFTEVLADDPEEVAEREAVAEAAGIELCSICHVGGKLYHVNNGKKVCFSCMLEMPQEKRVKELLNSGHAFLFRAAAGYGNVEKNCDTTNFRFIDRSPEAAPDEPWRSRSWGMGIWRPGDYRTEGTPANEFYKLLQMNPNGTEG